MSQQVLNRFLEILSAFVAERSNAAVPLQCEPLFEDPRGEFSTGALRLLAAETGIGQSILWEELRPQLHSLSESLRFTFTSGYISVGGANGVPLTIEEPLPSSFFPPRGTTHALTLCPATTESSNLAYARLTAATTLHQHLLSAAGYPTTCGDLGANPVSLSVLAELIAGRSRPPALVSGAAEELVQRLLSRAAATRAIAWLPPDLFSRAVFRWITDQIKAATPNAAHGEQILLVIPERSWIAVAPGEFDLATELAPCSERDLQLQLCSPCSLNEIDLSAAAQQERGNLRWYLRTTLERGTRLGLDTLSTAGTSSSELAPAHTQALDHQSRFLLSALNWKLWRGEIQQLMALVVTFLDLVNRELNAPETRRALASGADQTTTISSVMTLRRSWPTVKTLAKWFLGD